VGLISLLVSQEALTVISFERLAEEVNPSAELWATRSSGPARLLAIPLSRELHTFEEDRRMAHSAAVAMRYAGIVRRFSAAQIKEIFLDNMTQATNGARALPRDRVVLLSLSCWYPALTEMCRAWQAPTLACSRSSLF
jgi:hypothetical protein